MHILYSFFTIIITAIIIGLSSFLPSIVFWFLTFSLIAVIIVMLAMMLIPVLKGSPYLLAFLLAILVGGDIRSFIHACTLLLLISFLPAFGNRLGSKVARTCPFPLCVPNLFSVIFISLDHRQNRSPPLWWGRASPSSSPSSWILWLMVKSYPLTPSSISDAITPLLNMLLSKAYIYIYQREADLP